MEEHIKDSLKISQAKLEHRKVIALERQVISLEKIAEELSRIARSL